MSDDLIERLARQTGLEPYIGRASEDSDTHTVWEHENGSDIRDETLRRFAALVAEECAKVAEHTYGEAGYSDEAAEAIRAKFKEPPRAAVVGERVTTYLGPGAGTLTTWVEEAGPKEPTNG